MDALQGSDQFLRWLSAPQNAPAVAAVVLATSAVWFVAWRLSAWLQRRRFARRLSALSPPDESTGSGLDLHLDPVLSDQVRRIMAALETLAVKAVGPQIPVAGPEADSEHPMKKFARALREVEEARRHQPPKE